MKETILSGHVLVSNNNKVLLIRHEEGATHRSGVYGIPGGRPEAGEELKDTAVREFKEETGLTVQKEDLIEYPNNQFSADIAKKDGTTKHYTMTVFRAHKFAGELKATEETTPEWINQEDLDQLNLLPNVKTAVLEALKVLAY